MNTADEAPSCNGHRQEFPNLLPATVNVCLGGCSHTKLMQPKYPQGVWIKGARIEFTMKSLKLGPERLLAEKRGVDRKSLRRSHRIN